MLIMDLLDNPQLKHQSGHHINDMLYTFRKRGGWYPSYIDGHEWVRLCWHIKVWHDGSNARHACQLACPRGGTIVVVHARFMEMYTDNSRGARDELNTLKMHSYDPSTGNPLVVEQIAGRR